MMNSCRSGVFLPMKNESSSSLLVRWWRFTGSRRMASPMKSLNLAGGDFAEALEARDFVGRAEFAASLPQQRHAIHREVRIACHQRHGFDLGLCDEQAIEWVAMVMLQSAHGGEMGDIDR